MLILGRNYKIKLKIYVLLYQEELYLHYVYKQMTYFTIDIYTIFKFCTYLVKKVNYHEADQEITLLKQSGVLHSLKLNKTHWESPWNNVFLTFPRFRITCPLTERPARFLVPCQDRYNTSIWTWLASFFSSLIDIDCLILYA